MQFYNNMHSANVGKATSTSDCAWFKCWVFVSLAQTNNFNKTVR